MRKFLSKCDLLLVIPVEQASNFIPEIARVSVNKKKRCERRSVAVQHVVLMSAYRWQLYVRHSAI